MQEKVIAASSTQLERPLVGESSSPILADDARRAALVAPVAVVALVHARMPRSAGCANKCGLRGLRAAQEIGHVRLASSVHCGGSHTRGQCACCSLRRYAAHLRMQHTAPQNTPAFQFCLRCIECLLQRLHDRHAQRQAAFFIFCVRTVATNARTLKAQDRQTRQRWWCGMAGVRRTSVDGDGTPPVAMQTSASTQRPSSRYVWRACGLPGVRPPEEKARERQRLGTHGRHGRCAYTPACRTETAVFSGITRVWAGQRTTALRWCRREYTRPDRRSCVPGSAGCS